jgi:hypothetical protein
MRLSITALLSLFGVLLLAPAAGVAAGPRTAAGPQAEFSLRADGYSVSVEGSGRQVVLRVERGFVAAAYVTQGRASPGGIRARFGHLGLVSVRFEPIGRGRRVRPPRRCEGRPAIVRSGVFTGTIRFRGEEDYISIDSRRAKGRSSTLPRWRCKGRKSAGASARPKRPKFEEAELLATTPRERVTFGASGLRIKGGPSLIFFTASSVERRGSVKIVRFAIAISDKGRTFFFKEAPRSAKVQPPKPFHGSAAFGREPDGTPTWTGDLSVSLPGATIDLTGPQFEAKLIRPKSTKEVLGLSGMPMPAFF